MKYILKQASPEAFENWKTHEHPTNWNDLDGKPLAIEKRVVGHYYYSKEELREALLQEQAYTCCYCEMYLKNHPLTTKIEHIQPRKGDTKVERIFDYKNLAASCNGGERDPKPKILHCDTAKGDKTINITPHQKRCETEIQFTIEGKI